MSRARRRAVAAVAAATALSAAIAASGSGTTYAAFSDFVVVEGNEVGAARVVVGLPGGSAPELVYQGLLPGVPKTETLPISYTGTIPGDLALEFRPQGGSAFCEPATGGTWVAKVGGAVQLSVGGGWLDYCSLLNPGAAVPIQSNVPPGSAVDVSVSVQLVSGTDYRYSELMDVDKLSVTARQTGVGAFTDWAIGTISIGTGLIQPSIPAECGDVGQYKEIITGTDGDDVINAGNHKQIVLGLGGNDVIDGGNGKDCLVGGDGDDVLEGGNAPDIMIGGNGFDTCNGEHAPDTYECESTTELTAPSTFAATGDEQPVEVEPPPPTEDSSTEDPAEPPGTETNLEAPIPEAEDPAAEDDPSP